MKRSRNQSFIMSLSISCYQSLSWTCHQLCLKLRSTFNQFQKYSIITRIFLSLLIMFVLTTFIHIILFDDTMQKPLNNNSNINKAINTANKWKNKDIPFSDSIDTAKQRLKSAKKILFGYGQNCCVQALSRLCDNGIRNAHFDKCFKFNQTSLDKEFVDQHKDIFAEWRGAGYWLWKPFLINKLLSDDKLLNAGDYLVYMDAGAYPKANFDDIFEFVEMNKEYNGVLFFGVGLPQKEWCKRDAYILQKCDEEKCWNAGQINAFFSVWRKGKFAIDLSRMWLYDASNKSIIGDGQSKYGKELPGFRDHRHDQAVITNIMNREGFPYGPSGWRLENYIVHDRFTF
eukprot:87213_1